MEIIFREETNVKLTSIPTSDILKRSLSCCEVISHWESIVHDHSIEMNEECINSCLENILKLFITIRSYTRTRVVNSCIIITKRFSLNNNIYFLCFNLHKAHPFNLT